MESSHAVHSQANRSSQIKKQGIKEIIASPNYHGTLQLQEDCFENHIEQNTGTDDLPEINLLANELLRSCESTLSNQNGCIASQDTVDESCRLYRFHCTRELMSNDIQIPNYEDVTYEGYPMHLTAIVMLADRFRNSPQRRWVYERAQSVNLETLNCNTFQHLLDGLFQEDGVTWERVLVLFFFCTDLAARAFHEKLLHYFICINQWSWSYIHNSLSNWVEENGGWGEVLSESVDPIRKFAIFSICCIGVIALILYIKRMKN